MSSERLGFPAFRYHPKMDDSDVCLKTQPKTAVHSAKRFPSSSLTNTVPFKLHAFTFEFQEPSHQRFEAHSEIHPRGSINELTGVISALRNTSAVLLSINNHNDRRNNTSIVRNANVNVLELHYLEM